VSAQALHLGLQIVQATFQSLAVGTPDGFHAEIIRTSQTRRGTADSGGTDQFELETLIKYPPSNPRAAAARAGYGRRGRWQACADVG
jgi:hypothetical protein